jgi:hypothetical protein
VEHFSSVLIPLRFQYQKKPRKKVVVGKSSVVGVHHQRFTRQSSSTHRPPLEWYFSHGQDYLMNTWNWCSPPPKVSAHGGVHNSIFSTRYLLHHLTCHSTNDRRHEWRGCGKIGKSFCFDAHSNRSSVFFTQNWLSGKLRSTQRWWISICVEWGLGERCELGRRSTYNNFVFFHGVNQFVNLLHLHVVLFLWLRHVHVWRKVEKKARVDGWAKKEIEVIFSCRRDDFKSKWSFARSSVVMVDILWLQLTKTLLKKQCCYCFPQESHQTRSHVD